MLKALKTPALAMVFLAAACGQPGDPMATASTGPVEPSREPSPASAAAPTSAVPVSAPADLAGRLDCLRASGGVLLIGHRGGPTRDYPENAIETLERTYKAGTHAMEIDIAQTKDGVLTLMHDDDLARTSTGAGLVSDHTWDEISKLKLETYSKTTDFHPPKLEDVLAWAVRNRAILELDKKKSAPWAPIIDQVRAAKAENSVFLITYTDDQAAEVHNLAPDLVVTATVDSLTRLEGLLAKGVKADRLIAWTGTVKPDADLWKALAAKDIEAAFGTLGPRSSSLDDRYFEDGDGGEFNGLVTSGLPILVTDMTDKVSRQLSQDLAKAKACGL
jgi:glycerophosphoryl diester phosphodiesterase